MGLFYNNPKPKWGVLLAKQNVSYIIKAQRLTSNSLWY